MHVRRAAAAAAAAMDAGQQVAEGNALALVAVAAAATAGAGAGAGGPKEPAGLACPRCDSTDTKFCYYNNYNLGQPRHFCKGCRRYWTRGGALRNVPVGGGSRKPSPAARRKRTSASSSATTVPAGPLSISAPAYATVQRPYDLPPFVPAAALVASPLAAGDPERRLMDHHNRRLLVDPDRRLLELGGSFTSLLAPAPDGRFSSSAGFLVPPVTPPPPASSAHPALLPPVSPQRLPEGLIWAMGWPDLSI